MNHLLDINQTLKFKLKKIHDEYDGYACNAAVGTYALFHSISLSTRQNMPTVGWELLSKQYE